MRAHMTRAEAWLRFAGACALLAIGAAAAQGCGSSGSGEPSSVEAGTGDASAPDGTVGPSTDGGQSTDDAADAGTLAIDAGPA